MYTKIQERENNQQNYFVKKYVSNNKETYFNI